MRFQKLLTTIKKHTWWEEKSPAVYQFVMHPLHCFVEQCRYFHPKLLSISAFVSTPGDFFHELTPQDEKSEVYWYIYQQVKQNPHNLIAKKKAGDRNKVFIEVCRQFERHAGALTDRQVWQSYDRMFRYYLDYARYVVMSECVDVFTAYELEALVRKELPNVTENQLLEITRVMATPAHLSFMEKEHARILQMAVSLYKKIKRNPRIRYDDLDGRWKKEFERLSQEYYWLKNSYATVFRLQAGDFFQKVKEEVGEKSVTEIRRELKGLQSKVQRLHIAHRQLKRRYAFSKDLMRHFRLVQFFGKWIDERKSYMLRGNDCFERYCQEVARRFSIPVHDVRYYLPVDMKNILLHGKKLSKKIIHGRQTLSAYVTEKRGRIAVPTVYYGKQAKTILRTIQGQFQVKKGVVVGQVASAPVKAFTGRVQVVKDVYKETFTPGRILVTSMTRPDFVPLMRKAAAIITDEGGLTCHAAIVSRELKVPCIIGTKNATMELKTGSVVMMDLDSGKIIKQTD